MLNRIAQGGTRHNGDEPHDRRANDVADKCVSKIKMPHVDWYILDSLDKTKATPGVLGEAQIAWLATGRHRRTFGCWRPDNPRARKLIVSDATKP